MKPTIHQNIERRDYAALVGPDGEPLENQSKAKHATRCAWDYYMKFENDARPAFKETDPMIFGTIAHEMGLEDKHDYLVFDGHRRGKKWDDHKLKCEHEGKYPITSESGKLNLKDLTGASNSLKEAMDELGIAGDAECAITFEQYGVPCKALLDKLTADLVVVDAKFTEDIREDKFTRKALGKDFQYDYQMAWYTNAVMAAYETDMREPHMFIVVQPTYPYEWDIHCFVNDVLANAEIKIERSLGNLRKARETGNWSHPKRDVNSIAPPLYLMDLDGDGNTGG